MRLVELFTSGPARVLGMTRRIAENEPGDLTIFSQATTGHSSRKNPPANHAIHLRRTNLPRRRWQRSSRTNCLPKIDLPQRYRSAEKN